MRCQYLVSGCLNRQLRTMVSCLKLIKSAELSPDIRRKFSRRFLGRFCTLSTVGLLLGRFCGCFALHFSRFAFVGCAHFRGSFWCVDLGSIRPAGLIVVPDGEFRLEFFGVGSSNGSACVASWAGAPTRGEVAGGRTASGIGAGDGILSGLLASLFLCDARVDGVAEALAIVLV
jgi:hypothetical protein